MSWNEPGGGKKDPWSGRGDQKGPPEIDEVIRSLQEKLGNLFGGGKSSGEGGLPSGPSGKSWMILLAVGFALWLGSGLYIVQEGNEGVETRFGQYTRTTSAGWRWHLPAPIANVDIVNVKQQRYIEVGYRTGGADQSSGSVPKEALMLTQDENIVDVRLAVQYQVKDARAFIFNILNPVLTLKQVTESAERGVVGNSDMDFVLTEGRSVVVAQIKKEIQDVMDSYNSGIQITSVNLQDAQPPEQVQSSFEDAIKAREDKQRLINEAEAYANDVVPKARGAAARTLEEAQGYREQIVAKAEGETARFGKLLFEYTKAPDVTRKRLYIESMQSVLSSLDKVVVDVKGGNNIMYLPLDKMVPHHQSASSANAADNKADTHQQMTTQAVPEDHQSSLSRVSSRGRDGREPRGRQ
ncbi:MAG: FtsH protease activity modulator HflK [Methylomonas sp.]|nr:MAG: FtsH protease activity modulator HflK [Methylobacter sp.]PPD37222.1 MAG: FtsH protease activity modulator HflK [Methylomonas sp.]